MAASMDAYRIGLGPAVTAVQEGCVRLWGLRPTQAGSLRASDDYYSGHRPNSSQWRSIRASRSNCER